MNKQQKRKKAARCSLMDEIYRAHSQTVYRYLLSLTHDADVSEELTQETFYQAVKSIRRFDGSCKITTWLCAIAKNLFAAYRRKSGKHFPSQRALTAVKSGRGKLRGHFFTGD